MESWIAIKGYENLYEVSNYGNVRSLDRKVKGSHNNITFKKGVYLKPQKTKKGYLSIGLSNSSFKKVTIHRLVGLHFIPNPLNLPQINHLDGNKENNNDWNLEWSNNRNNQLHAWKYGLQPKRKENTKKFSKDILVLIEKLYISGKNRKEISDELNLSINTIKYILNKLLKNKIITKRDDRLRKTKNHINKILQSRYGNFIISKIDENGNKVSFNSAKEESIKENIALSSVYNYINKGKLVKEPIT